MFFAIDNHRCDLLVHEDEDGSESSGDRGSNGCPPWIASKRRNDPPTSFPSWLEFLGDHELWRVDPDEKVRDRHGEDGEDHSKVAHHYTNLSVAQLFMIL